MASKYTFKKFKNILFDSMISEGKHWPEDYEKTALNTIKNSPLGKQDWYTDTMLEIDVNTFVDEFEPLSHKNSNLGYFAAIIRWFIQYSGTNRNKCNSFYSRKLGGIIRDLLWLSNSPQEESKVKEQLKTKWTFNDFEKFQKDVIEKKRNADIGIRKQSNVEYEIVPIFSYRQLNSTFGGEWTGYKGSSEWCHTNGESTYTSWIDGGKYMFFILARKDWQNIKPPEPDTTTAYDEYGLSLIALLVKLSNGDLMNATLRWNHIISPADVVPGASTDHAFSTWDQLSSTMGFDVGALASKTLASARETQKRKLQQANDDLTEIMKKFANKQDGVVNEEKLLENGFEKSLKNYITRLVIPEGIALIDDDTFYDFEGVKELVLPSTIITIGKFAFAYLPELETLVLPDNLGLINSYAFSHCEKLKTIKFNNKLTLIAPGAFECCEALESIEFSDSIKHIQSGCFANCHSLKHVKFGSGLESIGDKAFYNCEEIESIELPDTVNELGERVFHGCNNLKSIKFPADLKKIPDNFVDSCEKLTDVVFPSSIESIGERAFRRCNLTNLVLPSTIKEIGDAAFYECVQLKSVDLSNCQLRELSSAIFKDCWNIETVKLPESLKQIGVSAFAQCILNEINIPDGVERIDDFAFMKCFFKNIKLPSKLKVVGYGAFSNCVQLESIVIPDEIDSMNNSIFEGCSRLKYVKLGKNLANITIAMFSSCTSLERIDFNDNLKAIYASAFEYCYGLKSIILPDSVEIIGSNTFKGCKNLVELKLPAKLDKVGSGIVYDCPKNIKITGSNNAIEIFNSKTQQRESNKMRFSEFKEMLLERI